MNGKSAGAAWTSPFELDVTTTLQLGRKVVQIATNPWMNQLIGDRQLGVTRRYTFTTLPTYHPDAPLLPSV